MNIRLTFVRLTETQRKANVEKLLFSKNCFTLLVQFLNMLSPFKDRVIKCSQGMVHNVFP